MPRLNFNQATGNNKAVTPAKLGLRKLTEQMLLQQVTPPSALVNEQGDILYLHGRTGMFLELSPGVSGVNNVIKMAHEGLRPGLVAALHKAIETRQVTCSPCLQVKTNGHFTTMNLTILPVTAGSVAASSPLYLITMEEVQAAASQQPTQNVARHILDTNGTNSEAIIATLKQELRIKDEYIQTAQEELESSTEELKSSNEEMQSVNEELQSTNEELETSKEELQSVNEELATVNAELQIKVLDLSRANNDMNNLLAGTGIGTIFVDHQLRILRFTPAASTVINVILSDVGRPVGHLVSNLPAYHNLVADIKSVLNTLIPKELEVQSIENKWYAMRIQPYRTLDNVIEGAVISFVDISETVQIRNSLHQANESMRLSMVARDANDAVSVQDLNGQIIAWNPGSVRLYGWSEKEALQMNILDRVPKPLRREELKKIIRLADTDILEPYHTERMSKDASIVKIQLFATALVDDTKKVYAIATIERAYHT
jgi:two-component system CheB/CheR fusion protein